MEPSREIRAMRSMAWERAKGELRSMLQTYWDEHDKFNAMAEEIILFISKVEDNGLQE